MACGEIYGPLVKRLRHRPLTPVTGVRFPHGSPEFSLPFFTLLSWRVPSSLVISLAGGYCTEVPPVPIPNTAVKLSCAEDTWREAAWENRALPALIKNGHSAVFYTVCAYNTEAPPVPIPNTVVKLSRAENTWREAAREDRLTQTS